MPDGPVWERVEFVDVGSSKRRLVVTEAKRARQVEVPTRTLLQFPQIHQAAGPRSKTNWRDPRSIANEMENGKLVNHMDSRRRD